MNDLTRSVRTLWQQAGGPPSRRLARMCNGEITHTTVATVLNGKRTVRWSSVVQVVKALGGDPQQFRVAWEREYERYEAQRQANAGRNRPKVVAGTVVRPGDTIVFTYQGERDDIDTIHGQLMQMLPEVEVVLVAGMTATVVRREEVPAGARTRSTRR